MRYGAGRRRCGTPMFGLQFGAAGWRRGGIRNGRLRARWWRRTSAFYRSEVSELRSRGGNLRGMHGEQKQGQQLTLAELAVENLLKRLVDLPVWRAVLLADRAEDGHGGLLVRRESKYTLVFQRTRFHQKVPHWANGLDEAREHLRSYVKSGKLCDPEQRGEP